ncbi:PREDICTED: pentatricopeptide repeat-containing protein At5g48730, chloroplastic [Tarenaya hassleriana]|uniref:pentatricopeptide repeat-containing protein At5g48730, chloroplastic n=1 Tax=Tarenaya hassleriana TaxID=28532 RepID=UPI00053C644F|nr:PREDICTED: pentatricopeptide repeat-containing protein At5g48730, chloroplastic [Tarenaya hassleriana]
MVSLSTSTNHTHPFPPAFNRRPATTTRQVRCVSISSDESEPTVPSPSDMSTRGLAVTETRQRKWLIDAEEMKKREATERREEKNMKLASRKAMSLILRREATKAVIEKKRGPKGSKKLLPRTVLEALHERITALRWESALQVFELLQEQLWYRPNVGIYIKLIVMLGKCKQPKKAHELFQALVDEGCIVNHEAYTALLSAYSRSGRFSEAYSLLERMKSTPNCQPDVHTYSILIKSCLQVSAFDKVQALLSDMRRQGIQPNTITYNTLIDAYGKAKMFVEMESTLIQMLGEKDCKPDVWTMNSTLRAFGGNGQIEMMEKCYEKFQSSGIEPNIKTFNILLDSYGKTGNYKKMSAVMEFMQKYHYSWTIVTYNVVIDAFGRAGDLKQMEYLFRLMQSNFTVQERKGSINTCCIIPEQRRAGKADKIAGVLRFIENSDIRLDIVFFNCLVDAYGRMEKFAEMKGVLEVMDRKGSKPDKITYKTMMKAYRISGMTSHVKELTALVESTDEGQAGSKKPDF